MLLTKPKVNVYCWVFSNGIVYDYEVFVFVTFRWQALLDASTARKEQLLKSQEKYKKVSDHSGSHYTHTDLHFALLCFTLLCFTSLCFVLHHFPFFLLYYFVHSLSFTEFIFKLYILFSRWKTCTYCSLRRLQHSTVGLKMQKKISLIPSVVIPSRKLK